MNTSSPSTSSAQRPEDENLGLGANLAYGLQHVLTMYGGIVAVSYTHLTLPTSDLV